VLRGDGVESPRCALPVVVTCTSLLHLPICLQLLPYATTSLNLQFISHPLPYLTLPYQACYRILLF